MRYGMKPGETAAFDGKTYRCVPYPHVGNRRASMCRWCAFDRMHHRKNAPLCLFLGCNGVATPRGRNVIYVCCGEARWKRCRNNNKQKPKQKQTL